MRGNISIKEEVAEEQLEVMSTFIQGTNHRRVRLGAAVCVTHFHHRSTFYNHQKKLIPRIESLTKGSIEKKETDLFSQRPIKASADGRYDSARDAIICSLAIMDCEDNIILDKKSVDKKEEDVSSNMLESRETQKTFERINKKIDLKVWKY